MRVFEEINAITNGEWFFTGSRALPKGSATFKSDWDVCIPVWWKEKIEQWAVKECIGGISDSNYSNGFKIDVKSDEYTGIVIKVNIIPLHPRHFLSWAMTTHQQVIQMNHLNKIFEEVYKGVPIPSFTKDDRTSNFEMFVALNRGNLPNIPYSDRMKGMSSIWNTLQNLPTDFI